LSKIKLHIGEISRILLSPDGKYIISAGVDGTIFMMSITDLSSEPIPGMLPPVPKDSTIPGSSLQPKGPQSTLTIDTKNAPDSHLTAEE
jgi:WD40 repeat protein